MAAGFRHDLAGHAAVGGGGSLGLLLALSFFRVDEESGSFMATLKASGFGSGVWPPGLNTVIAAGGSLLSREA